MVIGIDASRAFVKERTGIEEYSYQVIKELRNTALSRHEVVLYIRKGHSLDFDIPSSWKVKELWLPILWTQARLSLEMMLHPVDALFISAHVVPFIHPKKTFVTVHGLEYEHVQNAYSLWERWYMRWSIKNSCQWANKIIAVSSNTKKDLVNLYKVPESKIVVIYEGCNSNFQFSIFNFQTAPISIAEPYFLFIGRIEKRKNILGIVRAFEIVKEKYAITHKLVLVGKPGYGYEEIKSVIDKSRYSRDIVLTGYVREEEKWRLMKKADVFLFPTWSEGFGLPVLEAQSAGVPVIVSDTPLMREITGGSAMLVDPSRDDILAEKIAEAVKKKDLRDELREKGYENVKRFRWDECVKRVAEVLVSDK